MQVFNPLLTLLLAGSTPLLLADEHRQHGVHEHGTALHKGRLMHAVKTLSADAVHCQA